jgi:hypothetical protein
MVTCTELTYNLLEEYKEQPRKLIIGPGFKLPCEIDINDCSIDLIEWINKHLNTSFIRYDLVIASRVIEHFQFKNIDNYIYSIFSIMEKMEFLLL